MSDYEKKTIVGSFLEMAYNDGMDLELPLLRQLSTRNKPAVILYIRRTTGMGLVEAVAFLNSVEEEADG